MSRFKRRSLIFASVVLHLIAGGVIFHSWKPVASWYLNYRPILGVDFYNIASFVGFLARHFVFQFNGWKYIWWGGGPLSIDYPTLHAYLILPLLRFFTLPQAVQIYMLGCGFLFLFFSYFLFFEIGKDRVLAAVLTIASSFSIALYGALVWGGSLPYFATQLFLPLTLWLLVKFFNTHDWRWFYLSSLFLGMSFLGHPQVGLSYLIPISLLLLLAHPVEGEKFISGERVKRIFLYFLVALLAGYPQMGLYVGRSPRQILILLPARFFQILGLLIGTKRAPMPTLGGGQTVSGQMTAGVAEFNRAQLGRFVTNTNKLFFSFLVAAAIIFILSVLIRRKRESFLKALALALPALWVVFYNSLFGFGISVFHGGWYRIFWPFPLALGMLISFVWGDFWEAIKERLAVFGKKPVFSIILATTSGLIVLIPGLLLLRENSARKMLEAIEIPLLRQQSSAFPDSLNVYIDKGEFEKLGEKLTPSWLDPDETHYRLYEADQRVNIWWNALYDMPLVKGYVELPPGDASGAFYWTSIALSQFEGKDALVESWGTPSEVAHNNALFLIDWFSIKYIEAEHEKSDSYNPLTSYLAESDIFVNKEKVVIPGWAQLYTGVKGPIAWHPEEEEYLTYYEVKDELVSPIIHPTSASVVGVIGAQDAYQTIVRTLAAVNLNSRRAIPIKLGQFIDNVSYQSLKDMEAIILYAYDYRNHNRVWRKLEQYVKEGGKVFIETGSDVKQTDSVNLPVKYPRKLPSVFPIKMTKQEAMGADWDLSGEFKETEGIDFAAFGPPLLNGKPWLFSQPNSASDLKEGARVILANRGTPLVVSWKYGKGEVVWSGMNLPYHIMTHKSLEEARFFKNLLEDFVDLSPVSYRGFEAERKSPNKVVLKGSKAKGAIFRENSRPGWVVEVKSGPPAGRAGVKSQKLKIYKTGPTHHGFSYVRIPKEAQESFTITFSYKGEFWTHFWALVWLVTILLILDRVFFGSRLVVPVFRKISTPVRMRVARWWEREEEY